MTSKYHILLDRTIKGEFVQREHLDFGFEAKWPALKSAWRMQQDFDADGEPVTVYVADDTNVPVAPAVWAVRK